jgi:hypothetical protein
VNHLITGKGQAFEAAFGMLTCRIHVVVIRRQHRILAGTNGVMSWVVSAAAAEASKNTMALATMATMRVRASKRPLCAAHPREE